MRSGAYSYRKYWRYPIKIYSLGKGEKSLVFSKGVEIRQIILSLLIFGILFLFRGSISAVVPKTLELAFYVVLPWLLAGAICRSRLDGKRLDRFFIGYFQHLYHKQFHFSSHKAVYKPQMTKEQSYERFQ